MHGGMNPSQEKWLRLVPLNLFSGNRQTLHWSGWEVPRTSLVSSLLWGSMHHPLPSSLPLSHLLRLCWSGGWGWGFPLPFPRGLQVTSRVGLELRTQPQQEAWGARANAEMLPLYASLPLGRWLWRSRWSRTLYPKCKGPGSGLVQAIFIPL